MLTKANPIRSKKLRESARGEECTLNIYGICNHDPETTVLAHLPGEGGGMGTKVSDVCACFACHACHDAIDGRSLRLASEEREWYMRRAMVRTLHRWIERGLVTVTGGKV